MATLTLAPNSTWFSQGGTSVTRASITEINIVNSYTPTGNETASWDASADKDRSVMCYVNGTKLTLAGNGSGRIYANASSEHIFSDPTKTDYFSALTSITGIKVLDTRNVTTLRQAFRECKALPSLNLSNWDVSNVTTLGSIFQHCIALETVNLTGWNTKNVESLSSMFLTTATHGYMAVKRIIGIEKFDTRKVKDMTAIFQRCSSLENLDLSGWDTSSCESMQSMFASCRSLTELNLSGWDTRKVSAINSLFSDMPGLKKITLGANFSFTGDGSTSCKLPTPASGAWHSTITGAEVDPAAMPSNVACVYVTHVPAVLAPNCTWFSQDGTSVTRASITEIDIVDSYKATGGNTISWDASAVKNGSIMCYVEGTKLTISGNGSGRIYANADSSWVFSDSAKKDYFSALKTINGGDKLDTSNATTFERMFQYATALESIDVSNWDTSKVTTLKAMCQNATSIGNLDVSNWNTGEVTDMTGVFFMSGANKNTNLTSLNVRNWNTSKVTTMQSMFGGCIGLEYLDLSNWKMGEVTNVDQMFWGNSNYGHYMSLRSIGNTKNWDVSKVRTMKATFGSCFLLESLDVSNWNVGSVTSMAELFNHCSSLRELDVSKWDVSSAQFLNKAFRNCENLTSLDLRSWDNASCTETTDMFLGMNSLQKITVGANFRFLSGHGLPTPASGNWYSTKTAAALAPSEIPSNVACTYVTYAPAVLAPNSTWFAPSDASVTRASITRIDIVDSYAPTGKETASWDASVSKNGNVMCYVSGGVLTMAGNGSGEIWANEDSSKLFYNTATDNFGSLTHISGLDILDTRNATTLLGAFVRCTSLTSLDLRSWDVSNVTTLAAAFQYCISLETVDLTGWNTAKVTNIQTLFCSTTAVGPMKLKSILGIGDWDVSHVTHMGSAFQLCTKVETLDLSRWDVSGVGNMANLFEGSDSLRNLDLSGWDTTACTNMTNMFRWMDGLAKITLGPKFSFTGNGSTSCTLPTPDPTYIRGADGNWYDRTGKAYAPSAIPSNTANTYFASPLMLKYGAGTGKTYLLHQVLNRLPAYARTRKYHWGA